MLKPPYRWSIYHLPDTESSPHWSREDIWCIHRVMPKKLPSSSEAPWITLLAYHQRKLDLTTICWNYWGVTEALASPCQHSLHIWSFGQPAQILSAGYCPAGLGTGSSTNADRKPVPSLPQHSTDNRTTTEVFQLVHCMEHLLAKKSS